MRYIRYGAVTFALLVFICVGIGQAKAATVDDMLAQIQSLMAQITTLQQQLAVVRGEAQALLKDGLTEGMTDADIKKIQEVLATDPTIYPEGKTTGYYGPLTKEALKRFQSRHGISATGAVDDETHDLLEGYLKEGFGDRIPPGLLRAPGIMKKVEDRVCGEKGSSSVLCKTYKTDRDDSGSSTLKTRSKDDDDDEDEDEDEDEDDDDDRYEGSGGALPPTPVSTTTSGTVSAATVATHNTASSCWLTVNGKAYDVTQYVSYHPGGTSAILNQCGTDATAYFNGTRGTHAHSSSARNTLSGYLVGTVQ